MSQAYQIADRDPAATSHIHPFVDAQVVFIFSFLNNALMSMGRHAFLWHTDCNSFECMLRSGIIESYGNSMSRF